MKKRGFQPDFLRATFGPLLLNKTSRWDGDIHKAVKLWCSDPAAAEQKYGHMSKWDVSRVTNMSELFRDEADFNEDISAWDTSNVSNMENMFSYARAFNKPISGWDMSNVEDTWGMLCGASSSNEPINAWDVSNAEDILEHLR